MFSDGWCFLSTTGRKTQTIDKLRGKVQGQDFPVGNSSPFLHPSENFCPTLDQPHLILWDTLTFLPVVLLLVQPESHSQWHTNYAVFPSQLIVCSHIQVNESVVSHGSVCVTPETTLLPIDTMTPLLHRPELCNWLFFHDFPSSFMQ